ncbi:hypothetical protein GGR90_002664 [Sphingopyxis italica]|uniref:Uncharacterized protein n=1 Tax=Sphingopyxis italica TaxID=1129133 RepID=A0A7X6B957_9SPHN|nr:hypothetical protein [Sphingopyxis italica]NJB90470.1 hypothetical protein [Sphingopyxis italica]
MDLGQWALIGWVTSVGLCAFLACFNSTSSGKSGVGTWLKANIPGLALAALGAVFAGKHESMLTIWAIALLPGLIGGSFGLLIGWRLGSDRK